MPASSPGIIWTPATTATVTCGCRDASRAAGIDSLELAMDPHIVTATGSSPALRAGEGDRVAVEGADAHERFELVRDDYCASARLVVEIDGAGHDLESR